MRNTPNTLTLVERPACTEPCSYKLLGLPVAITTLHRVDSVASDLMELFEGPVWMLKEPHRCPFNRVGCEGIDRLPDACLRPFDPDSTPEPEQEVVVRSRELAHE